MENYFTRLKKFFREDLSEIVGAYFDGEKIFLVHLAEKIETLEVDEEGSEPEQLAKKISLVCAQNGWRTSAVGFCLQESDAVVYRFDVSNLSEKEFPSSVKSWAVAQAGADAVYSSIKIGAELWMETLPRTKVKEFVAAFDKFNLNLRGLSVMPVDLLTKNTPFSRAEFVSGLVRDKKPPNLLAAGSVWSWKKISFAAAAIFFIAMFLGSAKLLLDYRAASDKLHAAEISLEKIQSDVALKKTLDATVAELHKINSLAAKIEPDRKFNLLISLGKISDKNIRLTKIHIDGKSLELEGLADKSDAVINYLARVRKSVEKSARLESSSERDDGEILFTIRAEIK